MNIAHGLPAPLDTFNVDLPANQYKDFDLPSDSTYPLRGVNYPADYGFLPGYLGEDGHELDLFVGNSINGLCGSIMVDRGADMPNEHKFYVALTPAEVEKIITELSPVLVSHDKFETLDNLLNSIANFKVLPEAHR